MFDDNPDATIGDLYDPAMKVRTKEEAAAYLERLLAWAVRHHGQTREEALKIQIQNIGYFSGYCDHATSKRVLDLFDTMHPIFGKITPTPEQAFKAGQDFAARKP